MRGWACRGINRPDRIVPMHSSRRKLQEAMKPYAGVTVEQGTINVG